MSFKYFNVKNGLTTGNIALHSANANVQANYFLGNINVTNSANLGNVSNVKITGGTQAYVLSTDGTGNLSWVAQSGGGGATSNISNGTSNVSIPTVNGNINLTTAGNTTLVVTSTGANITGTANITGNVNAPYFIGNGYYLTGVDISPANISNGNSNVNIPTANGNINFSAIGNANVVVITGIGVNVAGDMQSTGNVNATYFVGNGFYLTGVSTNPANISNGTSNVEVSLNGNVTTSVNGNANILTVTGTGIVVTGNATIGTGTGGNLSGANIVTANLIDALTVNSAGNVNATYFVGNGAFLTGVATNPANISNGTSNVEVTLNGNVTTSVNGNANILIVTDTGIVVTGNATIGTGTGGNLSGANIVTANLIDALTVNSAGNVNATYFVGNGSFLTGVATNPANISNGTSNVEVSLNGNVTTSVTGNANILVVTGTGIVVTGNATIGTGTGGNMSGANIISANTFTALTSVNFVSASNVSLGAVGNVKITGGTSSYVLSTDGAGNLSWIAPGSGTTSISNGNSNVNIPVVNGNINFSAIGNANVVVITGTGANISGTANITGNLVTGNANLGNAAIANYFIGSGNNLSNIQGSNVTGQVGNSLVAGTVYTTAQPNITSVGTLTDLSVSGNGVFGGNLTVNGTLTYINSTTLSISDPIINLQTGPNGAAPVANTGKDVGTALNYYDTTAKIAWMGWDISNAEIAFGSEVSISAEVVTFTALANVRSGNAQLGNNVSANFFTGNGSILNSLTFGNITTFSTAGLTTDELYLQATTRLNVTASGNSGYLFDQYGATLNPALYVTSGQTLAFNLNVSTHPFLIQTSGGANYSVGLEHVDSIGTVTTTTSAQGQIAGTLYWKVPYGITGNYKYQCSAHGGMNGNIVVTDANIANIQVGNALVSGTVYTNAQPNITSVGNLTGLTVSNATGIVDFTTSANVTLGAVGNLHISGGTGGYVLSTDGSGTLSWVAQSGSGSANISNGNSNVNIPVVNGNVNISAVGNANVVVITGTGANITGTLNVSSNANVGNIGATNGVFTSVSGSGASLSSITGANVTGTVPSATSAGSATTAGTVTTAAQGNITSVGTLTGLTVSGATVLGSVANITINGGSNAYVLQTDGSGVLSWVAQSGTSISVDNFTGDGVVVNYTLTATPANVNSTLVSIAGTFQPRTVYSLAGNVITFSSAPPNTAPIEVTTFAAGGGSSGYTYVDISANTSATANTKYIVNTNTSNLTVTLPSSPTLGTEVGIIDGTGNASVHAITVGRNGGNIQGTASDMTVTTNRSAFTLVYYNAAQGWILTNV